MTALATTLQAFFTDRLARQRQVSPNTIAAYRDTLRLLLVFAADKKGKEPSKLDIDDLDALLIGAFLDDLEHQRIWSPRGSACHPVGRPCCLADLSPCDAFCTPNSSSSVPKTDVMLLTRRRNNFDSQL